MKKIILALTCLMSTVAIAQTDSTKSEVTGYVSVGVSVTNSSDFKASSYPSIEGGVMSKNLGLGLVIGRGNFIDLGNSNEKVSNYYYEAKVIGCFPMGVLSGSVILGYGEYFYTQHNFIEFGAGLSLSQGNMGYGVTYSNWDGVNYITPCITLNF